MLAGGASFGAVSTESLPRPRLLETRSVRLAAMDGSIPARLGRPRRGDPSMGITIIQKSDLGPKNQGRARSRGRALTGGAFKLGGLKALDDFPINRRSPISTCTWTERRSPARRPAGLRRPPTETLRALDGSSVQFAVPPGRLYQLTRTS
jgi:hypothetical protein